MLTRLRVKGFKNLVDVDVRFGPFTCIAGPNGAGKSNLFDAIAFLSHLSDKFFMDAARSVRGGDDILALFSDPETGVMEFRAEMLIPPKGVDDFGQQAEASATYVYYEIRLALERGQENQSGARLRLEHEELSYLAKRDAAQSLGFPTHPRWIDHVVKSSTRRASFIQTHTDEKRGKVVRLRSDRMQDSEKSKRGGGGATDFPADALPRSVLSSAQNADENRTAVLVRREMSSWRQLQLEPSSLRSVDSFESSPHIDASGRHIPAVLHRLSVEQYSGKDVWTRLANSLVSLVEDVRSVRVDRDEARRSLRFMMMDRNGLELPASSLSDGTMRFVALSVFELDPDESGLICLEEPENGIHPQRVTAMLELLYRISSEASSPPDADAPLRQVIISTHSPAVVKYLEVDDVVFAISSNARLNEKRVRAVSFLGLPGSWRATSQGRAIADGQAIAYLKGLPLMPEDSEVRRSVLSKYHRQLSLPLGEDD